MEAANPQDLPFSPPKSKDVAFFGKDALTEFVLILNQHSSASTEWFSAVNPCNIICGSF